MNRRTSLSLLTLLLAVFAVAGVSATAPSEPAVEPAAAPAGASEPAPAPACTEEGEAVTMAAELVPTAPEPADAGVGSSSSYGICYPNFCQQCWSDADCTAGNTCQFNAQCP